MSTNIYIWLINNRIKHHIIFNNEEDIIQKEFTCFDDKNIYNYKLKPLHFHNIDNINTNYIYCSVKFINKNGKELNDKNIDSFIEENSNPFEKYLEEYKIYSDNFNNGFNMGFTFKFMNSLDSYYVYDNYFPKQTKKIDYEHPYYIVKIEDTTPINSCYYYCYMRYYLESNHILSESVNKMNNLIDYYLGNNNWYSILFKVFINMFIKKRETNIGLTVNISLPELCLPNIELQKKECEEIKINKKKLNDIYNYTDESIKEENRVQYFFNRYKVNEIDIDCNNNKYYSDSRFNIYCNPFNILYYNLCVINGYNLELLTDNIKSKYDNIFRYKVDKLISQSTCVDIRYLDIYKLVKNKESVKLINNLLVIRYFYKYFDILKIIEEKSDIKENIEDCMKINKFLVEINGILSGDKHLNNIDKINIIAEKILDLLDYDVFKKNELYYIINKIMIISFNKCENNFDLNGFLRLLMNITRNELDNNKYILEILKNLENILNTAEDRFIVPPKLNILFHKLIHYNRSDKLVKINKIYKSINEILSNFKFDKEYEDMVFEYDMKDAIVNDFDSTLKNNVFEDNVIEGNIIENNEIEEPTYYISSWLGL
jgi:hypothetical protein